MVLAGIFLSLCQVVGHTLTVLHGDRMEFSGIHPTVERKMLLTAVLNIWKKKRLPVLRALRKQHVK